MGINCYLAMTATEFQNCPTLPSDMAWMACHFSPYGTGLTNLPEFLPEDSMLILNDRTPICGHDPIRILDQLTQCVETLRCGCLLLDFQRPAVEETGQLARLLSEKLPCPVGISALYCRETDAPVFLPPIPPDQSLQACLALWQGKEIWLEAALNSCEIILTEKGSEMQNIAAPFGDGTLHRDCALHCSYTISLSSGEVRFALHRTPEDLYSLLNAAQDLGVRRFIGLWQELYPFF